ncbi:GspH/FimT family pseudopilin [Psychromonas sp. 14N.309.X.WAT.B.A12]|uniref:GspH/FimT family pseudopilin n=1 Tax=Psychromonas sp. 14N.309.X.WAT.B.A12 TaxID=2998322 RepID=UPI0025AFAB93|nr:GspH/FimT family pseudopilin [Psychromonas sp. 14N.309.X.WAT.B.A12]MDN2663836.1 GspH/FimT family pseudopilin [Psychromonas sp. 14N.309.X.WAT.B.A12]
MIILKGKGFTLVELVVTLALLSIVIAISASSYQMLLANQALSSAASKLYYTLQLAKTEAIKRNVKVYVQFCQQGEQWSVGMSEASGCDCFTANSCQLDDVDNVQPLVDGEEVMLSQANMKFNGDQASYGALRFTVKTGSVTLTNQYQGALSVIQSAMRLRVCSPDKAALGYKKC